jgi:lipopolysaccharide/colanic/teichoic acid biosynthesis glycosyltransferase
MVVIALANLLISGKPVLFRQIRIGLNGVPFIIYKFRSMTVEGTGRGPVTVRGDPRVTPLGRILRKCKLDELPQLWNVLNGDMSFVGPRPEVPEYADLLRGPDRKILAMRPGITGPASIAYRNEETLLARQVDPRSYNQSVIYPAKITMNLVYFRDISFSRDLFWIIKTILPFFPEKLATGPNSQASRLDKEVEQHD